MVFIISVACLIVGCIAGFALFRYVATGKYRQIIEEASNPLAPPPITITCILSPLYRVDIFFPAAQYVIYTVKSGLSGFKEFCRDLREKRVR